MTNEEYEFKLATFQEFLTLGPRVWRNWDDVKDRVFLSMNSPNKGKQGVLAAVLCHQSGQHKQAAIGQVITNMAARYELLLSSKLQETPAAGREKVLLHELVHLGYSGHGENFRRVCIAVGGVVSGAAVEDPGFHMEKKVGARYKRMKTFDTEREAKEWFNSPVEIAKRQMEAQMLLARGESKEAVRRALRWRIVYG